MFWYMSQFVANEFIKDLDDKCLKSLTTSTGNASQEIAFNEFQNI